MSCKKTFLVAPLASAVALFVWGFIYKNGQKTPAF
jgi:hypothetical protein